jgi:acetyltransferase-like isoleucine patch superfamily enzyme
MIETYDVRDFLGKGKDQFHIEGEVRCSRAAKSKINITPMGAAPSKRSFQLEISDVSFVGAVLFGVGPGKHRCAIETAGKLKAVINFWRNSALWIGERTTINNARIFLDNAEMKVGKDNLWSDEIIVQTSDQHGIHDLDSGFILRAGRREMTFEEHVWIGRRALIMPDVRIGRGSIVGAGSTVTRDIDSFCVAAGSPARIVRSNSTWSRSPHNFSEYEKDWVAENRPS